MARGATTKRRRMFVTNEQGTSGGRTAVVREYPNHVSTTIANPNPKKRTFRARSLPSCGMFPTSIIEAMDSAGPKTRSESDSILSLIGGGESRVSAAFSGLPT